MRQECYNYGLMDVLTDRYQLCLEDKSASDTSVMKLSASHSVDTTR